MQRLLPQEPPERLTRSFLLQRNPLVGAVGTANPSFCPLFARSWGGGSRLNGHPVLNFMPCQAVLLTRGQLSYVNTGALLPTAAQD
eukprot:4528925-Amphidinium_carterae.2